MKTNLRTVTSAIAGICLTAAMFSGCTQMGTNAPGQTGQNQSYNRSGLPGNNLMSNRVNPGYGMNQGLGTNPGYAGRTIGLNGYGTGMTGYGTGTAQNLPNAGLNGASNYSNNGMRNNLTGNQTGNLNNSSGTRLSYGSTVNAASNTQKANTLRTQLLTMKGVGDCSTAVMGNSALVGIKPESGTKDTSGLKRKVSAMVRQLDGTITSVRVTTASDLYSRIKQLGLNLKDNKPLNTTTTEFNRLLGKM